MSDPREPGVPAELSCDEVRELAGSFVLGALTPAEQADVRAHLDTCDDAHAESAPVQSVSQTEAAALLLLIFFVLFGAYGQQRFQPLAHAGHAEGAARRA